MYNWEARAKLLEVENDTLRERVTQLEHEIGLSSERFPVFFDLTRNEAIIFGVLLNNVAPRKSAFMTALFSDRNENDSPDEKIIDVWLCKMRKKLAPFGIEIKTAWGLGYEMPEPSKAIARKLMADSESKVDTILT